MTSDQVKELLVGMTDELKHRGDEFDAVDVFDRLKYLGYDVDDIVHISTKTEIPLAFLGRALVKDLLYDIKQSFVDSHTTKVIYNFDNLPRLDFT